MAKGVTVTLYDAAGSPVASETDIAVLWFDSDSPPDLGAIRGQSAIATTTSGGVLSLDLDHVTGLAVGDWGFLVCYKLDGSDHEDSPTFASRMQVASMSGTTRLGPISTWVRNPDWPAQVPPVNGVQQITALALVNDNTANFVALSAAGAYTVDWGDGGSPENVATGVTAEHNWDYANIPGTIVGASKAVAVTFTDSGDTVNRTAHGYQNGQPVVFDTIVTTTGISVDTTYYVVNRAANTFQVASTLGGTALTLTTDGSGTVFLPEYKVAVVTITPQAANNITAFNLNKKHSQSGLQFYNGPWLSLSINSSALTTLTIGAASMVVGAMSFVEEFYLGENAVTDFTRLCFNAFSLQSLPVFNTSSGTTFTLAFGNCVSLRGVPLFDLSSATDVGTMFSACQALLTVPLFDLSAATSAVSMFTTCRDLQFVPGFDMSSCTNFTSMFQTCAALQTVGLIDTSAGTNFTSMFQSCNGLTSVPLLDLSAGTNFTSMFNACLSLTNYPHFDLSSGTNFDSMFGSCAAITVPLFNTAAGTNFVWMFSNSRIQVVPALNVAAGTAFTNMFVNSNSLSRARLAGTAQSISYTYAKLSAAELNNIFNGLATVTAKTITITGNYGAGSCTTSIATGKGWTVTN